MKPFNKISKIALLILLAALLLIQPGITHVLAVSDAEPPLDVVVQLDEPTLYKVVDGGQREPVDTYDDISFDDILQLSYKFDITPSQAADIKAKLAEDGGAYKARIPVWDGLISMGSDDEDITYNGAQFARLAYESDGVFLYFEGEFWDAADEPGDPEDELDEPEDEPDETEDEPDETENEPDEAEGIYGIEISVLCALDDSAAGGPGLGDISTFTTTEEGGGTEGGTEGDDEDDEFDTVNKEFLKAVSSYEVKLQKYTTKGYEDVKNDSTVSFNDLLQLVYKVTIKDDQHGEGKLTDLWTSINELHEGDEYYIDVPLPIPEGLKYVKATEEIIEINISEDDDNPVLVYFATLYPDPDGNGVFLHFKKEGFWTENLADTEEVEAGIYVACALKENITLADNKATILLQGNASVTITPTDPLPSGHTLTKTGLPVTGSANANTNKMIEWTVEYTATSAVTPPITFYDHFISTYHTFVVGSMKVSSNGGSSYTDVTPNVAHSTEEDDDTIAISYVYNKAVAAGQKIVFKYRTMLTNEALFGLDYDGTENVINYAEMRVRDTKYVEARGDVDITEEDRAEHWLAKKITNGDSKNMIYGKDIISWEVDIRAFDLGFNVFDLYDTIPEGLTLLDDTVKISVDGGKTYQKLTYWAAYGAILDKGESATPPGGSEPVPVFKLTLPTKSDGSSTYYQSYRVQYDTRISTAYLINVPEDNGGYIEPSYFDNKAWLVFDWPNGPGPYPTVRIPPQVNLAGVGVDVPIILKEGTYHADTHTISWKVTVNPYKIEILSGTIEDFFTNTGISSPASANDRNLQFLPGTFKSDKDTGNNAYFTLNPGHATTATGAKGRNSFTVTVNKTADNTSTLLGDKTATFTFDTLVLDEKNTEYNSSKTYTNNVDFDGTVKLYDTGGTSTTTAVKDQAADSPSVNSTVLAKTVGAYNYTDNSITWTVTVNSNQMPMTGASIVDTIPQYLYLDTSTIAVSAVAGFSATPSWSYDYTVSETDLTTATKEHAAAGATTLTVNLGDLANNKTVTIKYTTKLLVDVDVFKSKGSITVKNSVVLKRKNMLATNPIVKSQTIENTMLAKSGAFVKDPDTNQNTSEIKYTVLINPHGIDLMGYNTITDTLPKGLMLDIDSVKLWDATVTADGVMTPTTTEAEGWDFSDFDYTYSNGVRSFTITLPGNEPYVLTYKCVIVHGETSGNTFTNSISFDDDIYNQNSGAQSTGVLTYGGWALSRAKGSLSLIITKRDSKDKAPLPGVKFQLLTMFSGDTEPTVIMEDTTNAQGELTFYPLNFLRQYWVREVSGIEGYTNTGTAYAVDRDDSNQKQYTLDKYSLYIFTTDIRNGANGIMDVNINIYNHRDVYPFSFIKVTDAGKPLAGAKFTLTDDANGKVYPLATSKRDGVVLFENIPWGIYTLAETTTPSGYIKNTEKYTVIIDKDGHYTISILGGAELENSSLGQGKIVNTPKPSSPSGGGGGSDDPPADTPPTGGGPTITPTPRFFNIPVNWPPPPVQPTSTLIETEESDYVEITPEGILIGTWSFDEETWEWTLEPSDGVTHINNASINETNSDINDYGSGSHNTDDSSHNTDGSIFDYGSGNYNPDGTPLPQTGNYYLRPAILLALLGLVLVLFGFLLKRTSAN